jgi:hypothetical protein
MEKELEKSEVKKMTTAEQIWEEIKDRGIDIFALPEQKVNHYCSPVKIDPSKCYLQFKVGAVLPALEVALGSKYLVEMNNKYITVARVK